MNFKRVAFLDIADIERSASSLKPTDKIGAGCNLSVFKVQTGHMKLVVKSEIDSLDYTSDTMTAFLKTYYEYQSVLHDLGISTALTIPHFVRQANGTFKMMIIQDHFESQEFVDNIALNAPKEEVLSLFIQLINLFIKLSEYNRSKNRSFGLDFKLENLAIRHGQLILVDNIPLNDGYSPFKTIIRVPFTNMPLFDRNFSDLFDNILMLYLNFFARRQELDNDLINAIKEALPDNLYKEFCRKITGKMFIFKVGKKLRLLKRIDGLTAYVKTLKATLNSIGQLNPTLILKFIEDSIS